jgi:hypothetical protein
VEHGAEDVLNSLKKSVVGILTSVVAFSLAKSSSVVLMPNMKLCLSFKFVFLTVKLLTRHLTCVSVRVL